MDFLFQNDTISIAARPRLSQVSTFKKVNKDIAEAYYKQFPKGYEYTDEHGENKYRKYKIPENEPDLGEEKDYNIEEPDADPTI